MKILLNKCPGAFDLSEKALIQWAQKKQLPLYVTRGIPDDTFFIKAKSARQSPEDGKVKMEEMSRIDPDLIEIVSILKKDADTIYSKLDIVEIDDNISYTIEENDGFETLKLS